MVEKERLNRAIAQLAGDSDTNRLKKLLLCVCQQRWENDSRRLESLDWRVLLNELRTTFVTREQLEEALVRVVARINKKSLYFNLSLRAIAILDPLYPELDPPMAFDEAFLPFTQGNTSDGSLDRWFDLRLQLSQSGNLSQAKTLLYSAINGKFAYTLPDWNHLNHEEFDHLAQSLLDLCKTASELRLRLYGSAHCLNPVDIYKTIAERLCRTMEQAYYASIIQPFEPEDLADEDLDEMTMDGSMLPKKTALNPTESNTTQSQVPKTRPVETATGDDRHTTIGLDKDVEAAVCEAANQHLQAAIAAIDQQTESLLNEVRALVAHTDRATAEAIEARILHQFTDALGQFYHQDDP
ncbi:MAG: hypothetical protein JJU32_11260 [Phormidium sp. BM_Day4_Bin.17]|nr:hypothetical protein [Phormidium sp. BM_Day4_Bin.17]UCJ10557.1 MAG: hypothetical protein JWS08_11900 [Phormidium sp. PBR-2020]